MEAGNDKKPKKYIHCTLYKEGLGSAEAILLICRKLRIHPNRVQWAGRKDGHAKTSQRISVLGVQPNQLLYASSLRQNIKLGNYEYNNEPLKFGQLKGNHFQILLKNVQQRYVENDSLPSLIQEIENNMASFKNDGFINYFGLQRFGTPLEVSKAYLQMNWEKVVDLLLAPTIRDSEELAEAKKIWFSENDPIKVLNLYPNLPISKFPVEINLLKSLARDHEHDHQNNLRSAIYSIPKSIRTLYPVTYSSYIWNKMATFRIQEFGLSPIPGDFVYLVPPTDNNLSFSEDTKDECVWNWPKVKELTQEDIIGGSYSIYDVLLPVPGTSISKYPNKKLQDHFEALLRSDGLEIDVFSNFKHRKSAPKGSYRSVILKPQNVDWKIVPYKRTEELDNLIVSDWDILNGETTTSLNMETKHEAMEKAKTRICIKIDMSLPASCYATMALRQISKIV